MGNFSKKPLFILLISSLIIFGTASAFGGEGALPSYSISIIWLSMLVLLGTIIGGASVFLVMKNQLNCMMRLSNSDALTGLYGAREIKRLLSYDIERSSRYRNNLSLILLDVDNFVALTNEYGVKNGEKLLQQISHLLLKGIKYVNKEEKEFHGIRRSDIAFRYEDQDRILIILPETNVKGSQIAAERIREAIMFTEFSMFKSDKTLRTTISASVVSYHAKSDTVDTLLARADMLLLKAKITRNSIVMENPLGTMGTPYDVVSTT